MKKKLFLCLSILMVTGILNPINTKALQNNNYNKEEVLTCKYEYTSENVLQKELIYKIYNDNSLDIAFENGSYYNNNKVLWYHGDNYKQIYLESSKIDNNTYTCPSITIEENTDFITVFNNPKDKNKCNGICTTIYAKEQTLSSMAKQNNVKTKKIISTGIGSSVGIYQSKKYFIPYFRLLDDGTKQWSINGKKFITVDEHAIITTSNNEKTTIALNSDLINEVFKNNKINSNIQIYRCVTKTNSDYTYILSLEQSSCPKKDLSTKDGQEKKASSYNGSLGTRDDDNDTDNDVDTDRDTDTDDEDDDSSTGITQEEIDKWLDDYNQEQNCSGSESLLGDPNDEDSVAWLLQKILNYLKVLGPMIVVVMSSIDFGKAIVQSDDESMAKAQKKLIYRLLLAACLFFIPTLVSVLLDIFGITADPTCGLK